MVLSETPQFFFIQDGFRRSGRGAAGGREAVRSELTAALGWRSGPEWDGSLGSALRGSENQPWRDGAKRGIFGGKDGALWGGPSPRTGVGGLSSTAVAGTGTKPWTGGNFLPWPFHVFFSLFFFLNI